MKHILRALIKFYRWFISPLLGPNCRFHPTCSTYALESIEQHGAARGSWLAAKRICRSARSNAATSCPKRASQSRWVAATNCRITVPATASNSAAAQRTGCRRQLRHSRGAMPSGRCRHAPEGWPPSARSTGPRALWRGSNNWAAWWPPW